ncbi:HEPN domain-containing protein [Deinococcus altitudinis]|uniref:HEPN domain-containing protein n=1 Tax=Deinococcus altitudinis TaxID=468914 RepID=UPI0038925EC9
MKTYRPIPLTIIDKIFQDYKDVSEYLETNGQISLLSIAEDTFRKALLLSSASYFENVLQEIISRLATEKSNSDSMIMAIIKQKVVSRQYHTWFDWKRPSAGTFFAMLGDEYKNFMVIELKSDVVLKDCLDSFLEIGSVRNLLVHENFAQFPLQKTMDELYELYQKAMGFIYHCESTIC